MSTNLGNAAFTLTADTSGLKQGLDKANNELTQFTALAKRHVADVDSRLSRMGQGAAKGFSSALAGLGRLAGPAAVVAGIGTAVGGLLVREIGSTLQSGVSQVWGDALEKMAETTRTANVGRAFGVNPVEMNKIAGWWKAIGNDNPAELIEGMGQLQNKLAEALRGAPEAKKAFEDIGLSADKLANMDVVSQFRAITDAAARMGPGGRTVGLVGQILGTDFSKLFIPAIGQTSDALDKLGARFTVQAEGIAASAIATQRWRDITGDVSKEYEKLLFGIAPIVSVVAAIGKDMLTQFQSVVQLDKVDFGKIAVEGAYAFGALLDAGKRFAKELGHIVLNWIDNVADSIEAVYQLDLALKSMGINAETVFKGLIKYSGGAVSVLTQLSEIAARQNKDTPMESPLARRIKEGNAAARRGLAGLDTNFSNADYYGKLAQRNVDAYYREFQNRTNQIKNEKSIAQPPPTDGGAAEAAAAGAAGFDVAEKSAEKVHKLQQQQLRELRRQWNNLDKQASASSLGELIQAGTSGEWKLAARLQFENAGNRAEDEQRELLRRQLEALERLVEKEPIQLGVF